MGRIKVLPDAIANKIAAGEVVERPAAVVKELLENALDAGATHVRVEVHGGGRSMIRVADDGCGMVEDDALLAFERHATSKLREAADLFSIGTLGFRGEALPSIAGVSRLMLETQSVDEQIGTRVEIAGGKMINVSEIALPPGTTVTVKALFYNVPARRKFLRTQKTELAHVASLVTHYSLAHIDKSFYLSTESGPLLSVTPVETLRERVYQIFGSETLEQLVELEATERSLEVAPSPVPPSQAVSAALDDARRPARRIYRLRGLVSKPHIQKHNRNSIFVFVNNRLIRDRVALKAISNAYHNVLPPGLFPFALLFLDMPFEEVDVNVHPSKTEVRFRNQSFVHDFLRDTIRGLLIASKPVSSLPMPASPGQPAAGLPFSESTERMAREAPDEPRPVEVGGFALKPQAPPAARFDFSETPPIELGNEPPQSAPAANESAVPRSATVADSLHSRAPLVDTAPESLADVGGLRALGQINESFIVAAGRGGLWIIDQHVAHERILFEKVLARRRAAGLPNSQRLLMPIILTLKPEQEIVFDRIADEFRANGFELEPFGHRTVAVKSSPAELSPHAIETLLHEILETPERELRELSREELQKQMAATIACHAAIKVNTPLDGPKMRWLLDELAKTDCPMACPHGRPIALKYALQDILKAFHRV
jgi:DNA mismatch repair protein MutL